MQRVYGSARWDRAAAACLTIQIVAEYSSAGHGEQTNAIARADDSETRLSPNPGQTSPGPELRECLRSADWRRARC